MEYEKTGKQILYFQVGWLHIKVNELDEQGMRRPNDNLDRVKFEWQDSSGRSSHGVLH